jgi:predicted glycosyltransferase
VNRILFYCQSSLGIGHTIRSLRIAEGLSQSFEVHFLNGGELVPDLQVPEGINMIHRGGIQ